MHISVYYYVTRCSFAARPLAARGNDPWLNKLRGPVLIDEVYRAKRERNDKRQAELTRPVTAGWSDEMPAPAWTPPACADYDAGSQNGPESGPNSTALACTSLFVLWCCFYPLADLDATAAATNKHGNVDEMVEQTYGGGKKKTLRRATPADPPNVRRKRYEAVGQEWRAVTRYSLLVFIGILVAMAAMKVRSADMFWSESYSTRIPWITNSMTKNAFEQIRRMIHFVDNDELPAKGDHRWHPLQKVKPVLDMVRLNIGKMWKLGKYLCIDESMIACKSRAVGFLQYMPMKPVKHGVKVFVGTCATSSYPFAFEVYTGASADVDGSVVSIVTSLLSNLDLERNPGRVLFTDNFYTSIALMAALMGLYGMYLVGTVRIAKGKNNPEVFPFKKPSDAALKLVPRGWLRYAQRKSLRVACAGGVVIAIMWVQALIWKDRKLWGF